MHLLSVRSSLATTILDVMDGANLATPVRGTSPSGSLRSIASRSSLRPLPGDPVASAHPLDASIVGQDAASNESAAYPVYAKKRASIVPAEAQAIKLVDEQQNRSPSPGFPPQVSSPPTLPPLVSRPSENSQARSATIGRAPARSISEARELLESQNLKAEAQCLGLNLQSAGFLMLQKLSTLKKGDVEWAGIWQAITSDRTKLLLPNEKLPGVAFLTPSLFLDHLVIFDQQASTSAAPNQATQYFCTLSGFRGSLTADNRLVISSSGAYLGPLLKDRVTSGLVDYSSATIQDCLIHGHRRRVLEESAVAGPLLPVFTQISEPTDVPIPRLGRSGSSVVEQPMDVSEADRPSAGSRLAALFTKTPVPASTPVFASSTEMQSPVPTIALDEASTTTSSSRTLVPSIAVDKLVRHSETVKSVGKSFDTYIRTELRGVLGCSAEVIEQVCAYASRFLPPPNTQTTFLPLHRRPSMTGSDLYFAADVELVSATTQKLFVVLQQLVADELEREGEKELEKPPGYAEEVERQLNEALERVEMLLTEVLYDRLFCSIASEDAEEDEALRAKITALNLLELDFDHLGIDLEGDDELKAKLEAVVDRAADELRKLQHTDSQYPRAKTDILIRVHKCVVDGLSSLPPIRLRDLAAPRGEPNEDVELSPTASSHTPTPPPVPLERSSNPFDDEPEADDAPTKPASPAPQKKKSNFSSADLILPILIFLVVRENPKDLVSQLSFVRRFRAEALMGGEASYCLTSMTAVSSFLRTADTAALGLSPGAPLSPEIPRLPSAPAPEGKLRERVTSEVDELVDAANKAVANVVDSSFKLLFGPQGLGSRTIEDVRNALDGAAGGVAKARGTLLRRATTGGDFLTRSTVTAEPAPIDAAASASSNGAVAPPSPEKTMDGASSARKSLAARLALGSGVDKDRSATGTGDRGSLVERLTNKKDSVLAGLQARSRTSSLQPSPPVSPSPSSLSLASRLSYFAPGDSADLPYSGGIPRFLETEDAAALRLGDVAVLLADYKRLAERVRVLEDEKNEAVLTPTLG